MAFCINCGQEIVKGARFCANCGKAVGENDINGQRKSVYEGEIHKCPNCGEVLSAFAVTCPSCGFEFRGKKASDSVREFANRLIDIESDSQKVSLIQSFPIPSNKEDILEFIILAGTCFDASEKIAGEGVKRDVSNAWLTKVEQSYQKAKILFAEDNDFSKIQRVYDQTHKRIKESIDLMKKRKIAQVFLRTIGLWGGVVVFIIVFIMDIASSNSANTSVLHLGGATIMIIGALMIGKKFKELLDVGIGAVSGLVALLLGMLLEEVFGGNGSAMVLGGGATLVIVVVQLFRTLMQR